MDEWMNELMNERDLSITFDYYDYSNSEIPVSCCLILPSLFERTVKSMSLRTHFLVHLSFRPRFVGKTPNVPTTGITFELWDDINNCEHTKKTAN